MLSKDDLLQLVDLEVRWKRSEMKLTDSFVFFFFFFLQGEARQEMQSGSWGQENTWYCKRRMIK